MGRTPELRLTADPARRTRSTSNPRLPSATQREHPTGGRRPQTFMISSDKQACSRTQGVENARPQVPTETLRFSKWARKASHSSSVGVRYFSLAGWPGGCRKPLRAGMIGAHGVEVDLSGCPVSARLVASVAPG